MARLRYTNDDSPGIRRIGSAKRFRYETSAGAAVRGASQLKRIRLLAIPPAWTKVWICPTANGHIQATGRDERGRKQYRYHTQWSERQNLAKIDRMLEFGKALPTLRRAVKRDLKRKQPDREKVLAIVISILEETLIRVGNEEYAKTNNSFGLTTLRNSHVKVRGKKATFRFRGKSGVTHEIELKHEKLARCVRRCQELPGQHLFEYLGADGKVHRITSTDVNSYLREKMGQEFGAKDFRTWNGSVIAGEFLSKQKTSESETRAKRTVNECVKHVAENLGNTPATCRKYYIHPKIAELYKKGQLARLWNAKRRGARDLNKHESALLSLCKSS